MLKLGRLSSIYAGAFFCQPHDSGLKGRGNAALGVVAGRRGAAIEGATEESVSVDLIKSPTMRE
jgi:hypothetical protein